MTEAITLIEVIETVGIPTVLIGVGIFFLWKLYPHVVEAIKSYQEAKRARARADMKRAEAEFERNEIQRQQTAALNHSSSVIENCTAVIRSIDGGLQAAQSTIIKAIDDHEDASQCRDDRTERKQDDIISRIGNVQGNVGEIKQIVKLK